MLLIIVIDLLDETDRMPQLVYGWMQKVGPTFWHNI